VFPRAGRWIDTDNVEFLPTALGVVSSDGRSFHWSHGAWRAESGEVWSGPTNGRWIALDGTTFIACDGVWIGPGCKIFRLADDGRFYSDAGDVWEGLGFLMRAFEHERAQSGLYRLDDRVLIRRPRSETPTLRVIYQQEMAGKWWRTQPAKGQQMVYMLPPPHIVLDRRRVGQLIAQGALQLLPLIKQFGYNDDQQAQFVADCQHSIVEPTGARSSRKIFDRKNRPQARLAHLLKKPAESRSPRNGDLLNPFVINKLMRPIILTQKANAKSARCTRPSKRK
jgi:hypothetical protein